jgi:hypothetical protein
LWNDRTIEKLARGIYRERAFDRMPILGDALEEAGCHDSAILQHCRAQPSSQHVLGCWVLESLLAACARLTEERPEGLREVILPTGAWLVECKTKGRKNEFPFSEEVRPLILPVLDKDPLYLVSKSCNEELLQQSQDVRAVKEVWFLAESRGIALRDSAKGKVQVGPKGRVWVYTNTKREWALRDLADVYEPVKVLLELVKGPPGGRDLARSALEGDWKALPHLGRVLSRAGDSRLQALRSFLPPSEPAELPNSPEEELAALQASAAPCPRCGKPRLALRVKKEGPNQGRLFLRCTDRKCDSFEWAASGSAKPAPAQTGPLDLVQRGLRALYSECYRCSAANPALGRATKPGPNQGRFFLRCNECEKFDWLTDSDGDFMYPDIE